MADESSKTKKTWEPFQQEVAKILNPGGMAKRSRKRRIGTTTGLSHPYGPEISLVHLPLMKWAAMHPICRDYLAHWANERKCSLQQGALLKQMGVKAGMPDLLLLWPTKKYPAYFVELKAPGKKPTPVQYAMMDKLRSVGYAVDWFDDWEKAKNSILEYLAT